eukprot:15358751-Ditylum_brightwellii.AAC.1
MGEILVARDGDWLCALFQCDYCWFQNLLGGDSESNSLSDMHLLDFIRHENLDIMWAQAQSTVGLVVLGVHKGFGVVLQIVHVSLES